MKKNLEIINNPEYVSNILNSIRKDGHLSKTFDGTTKDGIISGFYTNLALINGMVIGYVKINGQYDCEKGNLKLKVVPSNLFWSITSITVVIIAFLTYKGFSQDKLFFFGSLIFLFMALGWIIAFKLESKSFIRHIDRIGKLKR